MRRYQQALAVLFVLLFFSSLDLYLFVSDVTTLTPKDWILLAAVATAPLAIHRLYREGLPNRQFGKLALWSSAYVALSVVWYAFSPSDVALQELRDRALAVTFMCLAGFIFSTPESRKTAGLGALVIVLVTVVINGIQMAQPTWFVMDMITRSCGLYVNANQCGAALAIGMIIGYQLVPRRLRLTFCLIVGAGVAITFSRSASGGWLIATGLLLVSDSTRARAREATVGGLIAVAMVVVAIQSARITGALDGLVLDDNQADRVSFFRTFDTSDDASNERKDVATKAWGMFVANPIRGNGLGATVQWSERSSTHNMYLFFLVDHGLIGLLILPSLMLFVLQARPKAAQGAHWAFCAFTVWYAFFSHNVFTERYQLLAFAFFAMGGTAGVEAVRGRVAQVARRPVVRTTSESFPAPAEAR